LQRCELVPCCGAQALCELARRGVGHAGNVCVSRRLATTLSTVLS
jgi:hypothetical protein